MRFYPRSRKIKGVIFVHATIGNRVKALRMLKGKNLNEICEEIRAVTDIYISPSKLSEIENITDINGDTVKDHGYRAFIALSKFYGVSTDYLFCLTDVKNHEEKQKDISTAIQCMKDALEHLKKYESEGLNNGVY
jgi:transcriptional regulator with XRE-family HTH domain